MNKPRDDFRKLYPDSMVRSHLETTPHRSPTRDENRVRLFEKYAGLLAEPGHDFSESEFRGLKSAISWRLDEPRRAELLRLFHASVERQGGLRMDSEWEAKGRGWLLNLAQMSGRGRAKPTAWRALLGGREISILSNWHSIRVVDLRHRVNPGTGRLVGWDTVYRVMSTDGDGFGYVVGDLGHRFEIIS